MFWFLSYTQLPSKFFISSTVLVIIGKLSLSSYQIEYPYDRVFRHFSSVFASMRVVSTEREPGGGRLTSNEITYRW